MKKIGKVLVLTSSILIAAPLMSNTPFDIIMAEASSNIKMKKTSFKTTANLNIRKGAGTKYKVSYTIPKGKIVTSTLKNGTWYKVTYTYKSKGKSITKTGWVSRTYLKEYYQYTKIAKSYYFTKTTTKLYSTPDTKKKAVYTIPGKNGFYSTQKVVNSVGQTWFRISYKGKVLYVNSNSVSKNSFTSFAKTKYTANKDTYLFHSYGNVNKKLVKIPKGTIVQSTKKISDWYSITFNGKSGYIYIKDFSPIAVITEKKIEDTTFITTAGLNLRKTADVSSTILTTIPNSKIVVATHKVSNGWYKVRYGSKIGYVSGSYIKEVRTGDPITSRTGYQFIDLRTKSPVTAKQINDYIAKYVKATGKISVLTGKGQAFINAGNKYGVNALYLAAHAIHESAYGTSNISLGKNNLFGFGAYDATPFVAAYRFATVDLNIDYIAREMKATYLNDKNWKYNGPYLGFSTKDLKNTRIDSNSEGMNFYYASDPYWGKTIAKHMENILPFDKAYYSKAVANTVVPAQPEKPDGSDIFPNGIQAVANQDIVLNSKQGVNDAVKKLKKKSTFFLIEKTNDYWVKVKVDNKIYWTNDINFVTYKKYLSVQNLGRVTATALNVRSAPNSTTIGTLNLNDYVQIVLQKDGKLTMDSTKTWYKVTLANGKTGWVSAKYIVDELK
ncbi:SH3 domain-containing protein [Heyndrickxia sp. NPDC080065]|uniref:SH3 domain-containing protein n=1 Tax=Heyndrickxia sp. NPDC080065 TaxID=3390568 RepID=UPI003D03CCDD